MSSADQPGAPPERRLQPPTAKLARVWAIRALVALICVWVVYQIFTNPGFGWDQVPRYFFNRSILQGVWLTSWLAIISMVVSIVLGVALALLARSKSPGFRLFAASYVAFFRSVPTLVLILLVYNIGAFWPVLGFWIPFTDIGFGVPVNTVINGISAAIIALGLQEAAYMSETVRAGLLSVPPEQIDAARGLGMTTRQANARIVLPQAIPVMLPPTGNAFVGQIKSTSLVAAIGGGDLLTNAQHIYQLNYQIIPLLMVALGWYIVLTILATLLFYWLERRFDTRAVPRPALAARLSNLFRPTSRVAVDAGAR